MASKGKAPAKAPSTRARGSTSQQQPPLEIQLYETPAHAEEPRPLKREKSFMSVPSSFLKERTPSRNRYWLEDGTSCMNQKVLNIPKFEGKCGYSEISVAYNKNELNMDDVLRVIGKEGATWWEDPHTPVIPAKPKKKILNYEAWMRLKLIVCNINPTSHDLCNEYRSHQIKESSALICYVHYQWAQDNNVPRLPRDVILKIPKSQQFFPYGKWREEEEEVAPPISPPVALADIPAPSAPSSPEPSRRDLMRALRRNERIMCRHEQLMLMLHPRFDTSGLEQIFSPKISQNQREQGAGSAEREDAEEDEDFQSAEATGDASTYAGGESAEDE
ncbi:hypothetical protein PIB30_053329 [Stylosanthes scabra]|uniref:Uncharacterized protein n=1 Tax=Stylosanthes scabra TaxID=79078 RepID=A0ABU6RIL7_9FABA|nr:hypothetical protein [Stylosanthes scabra]